MVDNRDDPENQLLAYMIGDNRRYHNFARKRLSPPETGAKGIVQPLVLMPLIHAWNGYTEVVWTCGVCTTVPS